jgi:signal transduction histidine kinase
MRILLVDDNQGVRRGIRSLLSSRAEFSICGEAADGVEAVERARILQPDAVLMDIAMPRMDGLQATRVIRRELPETKVIIVSQNDPVVMRRQAAEVEAHGWVGKGDLAHELIPAIERMLGGRNVTVSQPQPSAGSQSGPPAWLTGGGNMGALLRSTNFAKTLLGPAESWCPALRMMVKFLLANRFPQLLWWGPDFCCLYNDAYIPILGAKHPWALGRPCSEVWREIWHVLRPLIETPFQGGPATWMEDLPLEVNRRGFMEETHFTIAYSPVPDDTAPGGIGGVLATVHEITEKVIGERRVIALRDLGVRAVEPKSAEEACTIAAETLTRHSKDVPFLLLYLLDAKRQAANLVCGAGVDLNDPGCLKNIDVASKTSEEGWPLARALETEDVQPVEHLQGRFRCVPPGPWADPPSAAAIVPIRSNVTHQPAGLMVVGISARLQFDERYRNFLELMSAQIAASIAKARAYEEERKRAEALAEIDRAKTAFFSNVSHEFRTPLTLMLGPLQDLLSRSHTHLSPTAKEQLELVNRNGARLLRLVNTLLDFSRIEAGRVQAVYQATDLAAFTSELASVFRSATERAGLHLVVDCRNIGEPVYVDRDMWEKIVSNLLSNAFKFTFAGEIAVSVERAGNAAELRVRDTGVGIPAEAMPNLFKRFYRVANTRSRTYEGSGIGLALVNELVKLHGGSLRVESVLGHGSTFIASVPLGQDHLASGQLGGDRPMSSTAVGATPYVEEALRWLPDAPSSAVEDLLSSDDLLPVPCPPVAGAASASRPRILVADDNADMRQYLVRLLSERNAVEAVPDGHAVLAAARERPPDLILSDVMMPRLDGIELLRALRADPALKEIPIILLSARAGEESRLAGMESGADDYLVKPFSARELIARVEAHVKMHRLRQQAKITLEEQVRARTQELEQRNAEVMRQSEEVRSLSARLLQSQDAERRRIARELHDSAGQSLSVLGMKAASLAERVRGAAPALGKDMEELQALVAQLSQEIRTTSYLLHPPLLDETGVAGALQWYVQGFTARSGIDIQLQIDPNIGRFSAEIELTIFRIVQEALTNIHRHSGSQKGRIRVARSAAEVSIEIQDYGKGMPSGRLAEAQSNAPGVGLRGMRERVHQLHGQINLKSDGSGTIVSVVLPVNRELSHVARR